MKGLLIHFEVIEGKQESFHQTSATSWSNGSYVIDAMPAIDACLVGTPAVEWLDFIS
jgi:hypothetical protein